MTDAQTTFIMNNRSNVSVLKDFFGKTVENLAAARTVREADGIYHWRTVDMHDAITEREEGATLDERKKFFSTLDWAMSAYESTQLSNEKMKYIRARGLSWKQFSICGRLMFRNQCKSEGE